MKLLYCLILQRSHKTTGNNKRTTAAAQKSIVENKYVHGQWALDMDRIKVNTLFGTFFSCLDTIHSSTFQ